MKDQKQPTHKSTAYRILFYGQVARCDVYYAWVIYGEYISSRCKSLAQQSHFSYFKYY